MHIEVLRSRSACSVCNRRSVYEHSPASISACIQWWNTGLHTFALRCEQVAFNMLEDTFAVSAQEWGSEMQLRAS
jgi:hypothetical protein